MTQHDPNGMVPPPMVSYPPGAYGFPPQAAYPSAPRGNGLGIAALVLGLLGLLISWVPFVGLLGAVLAAVGLILGIVGFVLARSSPQGNSAMPLIGAILSVIAVVVSISVTTWTANKIGKIADDYKKAMARAEAESAAAAKIKAEQDAAAEKVEQAERQKLGLLPFRITSDRTDGFLSSPSNHWMTIVASGDLTKESVFAIVDYVRKNKSKAYNFHLNVLAEDPRAPGRKFAIYDSDKVFNDELLAAYRTAVGLPPASQPTTPRSSEAP